MVLVLVVAMLSGQVIYEWVDAQGQSHFTDDVTTIPKGVTRRETKGEEITVMPMPRAAPPPADQAAAPEPKVDTCAAAQGQVVQLEQQIEQARASAEQWIADQGFQCQQELHLYGNMVNPQCMAARLAPPPPDQAMLQQLEDANESLRRAQLSGCK